MYYQGVGVEKNWEKAKELYRKAGKHAEPLLEKLEAEEMEQIS